MQWSSSETRIRKYLRDPNAKIWSQDLLIDLWNQAQDQLNKDSRLHTKILGVHVPGINNYTTTYEWEQEYLEGSIRRFGLIDAANGYTVSYEWEIPQIRGLTPVDSDGYRSSHSWEIYTISGVVDLDILKFPDDFGSPLLVAWDRERLSPTTEEEIRSRGRAYRTNSGKPTEYMLIGQDEEREFALIPRPSSVTFDTYEYSVEDVDAGYSYDWETDYIPPDAKSWGKYTDTSNDHECIYRWEVPFIDGNHNPGPDYDFGGYYWTNSYEVVINDISEGMTISVDADSEDTEEGTFYRWDDCITESDYGIVVDYIPLEDNVLVVYIPRVTPVASPTDTIELWLDWQVKYIERKVVELAFLCNNNRYNPALSAFWGKRYKDGLEVLRRYKGKRTADRHVKLATQGYLPSRRVRGLVDLPDTYPSAWK